MANTADRWMQKANRSMEDRGTKGSFTRHAKREGHTVPEQAHIDESKSGTLGKRARMALAFEKVARDRKK